MLSFWHRWIIFSVSLSTIPCVSPPPTSSHSPGLLVYSVKHVFIDVAFIMTHGFWSLKHKSDVMQWAHGAWRLLANSSKIRLRCKKTSKCVRCRINSFLKDTLTHGSESRGFIRYVFILQSCNSCFNPEDQVDTTTSWSPTRPLFIVCAFHNSLNVFKEIQFKSRQVKHPSNGTGYRPPSLAASWDHLTTATSA